MKPYKDIDGDSGVAMYGHDDDWIDVVFRTSDVIYRYTKASAGADHVAVMKRLADAGDGLSAYISRYVKENYVSKRPLRRR